MIELSQFGTIIQKYAGNGQLSRKGSRPIECTFEAGQFSDGKIIAICSTAEDDFDAEDDEITLVGTTLEEGSLFAIGHAIQESSLKLSHEHEPFLQIVFRSSSEFHLGIGDEDWKGLARIHFYITNFNFEGIYWEEVAPGQRRRNHIKVILDKQEITIRQLNNYDQRIKQVEDRNETDITAELIIETSRGELSEAFDLISVLCDLLSIARGKRINWIYFEVFVDNKQVYREHQPQIVTPYAGFEVIDCMPPKNTVNFLTKCYPHYIRLDKKFRFHNVTNIYTDVRSRGFIETRCLSASSLIEYLAKKAGGGKLWLKNARDKCKVPIEDHEIERYIDIRNSLVHDMQWLPGSPQDQYLEVLHFLDRLLLRILEYEGCYINTTNLGYFSGSCPDVLIPLP